MKELNTYIIEKLKINKDTDVSIPSDIREVLTLIGIYKPEEEKDIDDFCDIISDWNAIRKDRKIHPVIFGRKDTLNKFGLKQKEMDKYWGEEGGQNKLMDILSKAENSNVVSNDKYSMFLAGDILVVCVFNPNGTKFVTTKNTLFLYCK